MLNHVEKSDCTLWVRGHKWCSTGEYVVRLKRCCTFKQADIGKLLKHMVMIKKHFLYVHTCQQRSWVRRINQVVVYVTFCQCLLSHIIFQKDSLLLASACSESTFIWRRWQDRLTWYHSGGKIRRVEVTLCPNLTHTHTHSGGNLTLHTPAMLSENRKWKKKK